MLVLALALPLVQLGAPSPGATVFGPMNDTNTYMVDAAGVVVQTWPSTRKPSSMVRLLDDGRLLRQTRVLVDGTPFLSCGFEEMRLDGTTTWSWDYLVPNEFGHHDFVVLPNGNILCLARELLTPAVAIAAGRDPATSGLSAFFTDHLVEIQKTGPTTGSIVWKWRVWDHLVQDRDPTAPEFDVVANRPERIDLNYPPTALFSGLWIISNGVDYHPGFDQVLISAREFDELWVIDQSTTTAEAAGTTGGRYGSGGDLLYRWGNPEAYGAGTSADRRLDSQHDPNWIEDGRPGAGNIIVFSNGSALPGRSNSVVVEIDPPVDAGGNYSLTPGAAFGPATPLWTYEGSPASSFFSPKLSGAERLANGNTLITDGVSGLVFEVDSIGTIVWQYQNVFPAGLPPSVFKARRHERWLWVDPDSISASASSNVGFDLLAGSIHAGKSYLLLASLSGTAPGTLLPGGGLTLPLNYDALAAAILANPVSPPFSGFLGVLDPVGRGSATLSIPTPLGPAMVGQSVDFAYTLIPSFEFVSESIPVTIGA